MKERMRFERETNNLGIDERFFESLYYPNFENDTAISNASLSIPALMKSPETTPLQQTLYVNISLGMDKEPGVDAKTGESKKYKVQPMTGIFIPQSFVPQKEIDIVLYLHGHKTKSPGNDASIDDYWNVGKNQHFALREEVNESKRNIIFVAPTLGPFAQFGNLTTAKGFDDYLGKVLAALNEHFIRKNSLPKVEGFGKIILAAHSGGGSPMLKIVDLKTSANASKISECWGFDSVYGGKDKNNLYVEKSWVNWAASHANAKLFIYYTGSTQTRSKTLEKLGRNKNLQNICVHEWSGKDFFDWEKAHPNLKKSYFSSHFWVPIVYLKERLQNSLWRTKQASSLESPIQQAATNFAPSNIGDATIKTGQTPSAIPKYEDSNDKFVLKEWNLETKKIKVSSVGSKENGNYKEYREAPSDFLPEIIRMAREMALKAGKNDIAAKLNPNQWFKQFTRINFLGRPLKSGQYLHLEMAKMLKAIETEFVKILGIGDAKKTGDILLHNSNEGISGSRLTSSTAVFSMHMFGLAVDVNRSGNPYIQEGGIKPVNNVLENAALLMNKAKLTYQRNTTGRFADRFDYIQELDSVIEDYFKLLDNPAELEQYLRATQSDVWRKLSVAAAKNKIQKNLDNLAGYLARGDMKEYFKNHAILDFDKRFVVGMENMKLHWGGWYGDMMHFDMRKFGVGEYIEKARQEYLGIVKRKAMKL